MKDPIHPGYIVKHDCIEPLGISVKEAAVAMKIARSTLSRVINGKAAISPEMAIRLEQTFGSTAETWIRMQAAFDLAQTRRLKES
jgi:addiction module HigA family antidote